MNHNIFDCALRSRTTYLVTRSDLSMVNVNMTHSARGPTTRPGADSQQRDNDDMMWSDMF